MLLLNSFWQLQDCNRTWDSVFYIMWLHGLKSARALNQFLRRNKVKVNLINMLCKTMHLQEQVSFHFFQYMKIFNVYFFSFSTENCTIKLIKKKTLWLLFNLHLCEQDDELLYNLRDFDDLLFFKYILSLFEDHVCIDKEQSQKI